jgi:hypothetical protein
MKGKQKSTTVFECKPEKRGTGTTERLEEV